MGERDRLSGLVFCAAGVLFAVPSLAWDEPHSSGVPAGEAEPRVTGGGEHVHAVHLLTIPRAEAGTVDAAATSQGGLYLAGNWWNREDKRNLWLWRVNDAGEKLWEKHLARQQRNEHLRIVGLLPGARRFGQGPPTAGVRVLYRQGSETKISFFNADGATILEKSIGLLENTYGVTERADGDMLLFGTTTVRRNHPLHAWAARVSRLGAIRWKTVYHAKSDAAGGSTEEAEPEAGIPSGSIASTSLFDAVELEDGSLVLVGQTGVYNKFGQGPSRLWLLRIDGAGRELDQASIDGGRIFPGGRDLIARCGDGVVVIYTNDQLPPIGSVPGKTAPTRFGSRLAGFNHELEQRWDKPFSQTIMPGAATLTGPVPLLSLTGDTDALLLRAVDEQGEEIWDARVTAPDGFITPVATRAREDDVVAVCNCRVRGAARTDQNQKVLLVFASHRQRE